MGKRIVESETPTAGGKKIISQNEINDIAKI
jgi:hypothetical protein